MKFLGMQLTFGGAPKTGEVLPPEQKAQSFTAASSMSGWFGIIRESFSGAWSRFMEVDAPREVLAFSAVFSCVTLIAADIAKLGADLLAEDPLTGIHKRLKTFSPYLQVLARPNRFQTWFKFIEQWVVQRLLYGNCYVLKERESIRGLVTALYVLDAQRVVVLVADDGGVYYQLGRDALSGLKEPITVPSTEIIHDSMTPLWHPLIGVSPIYACGLSATMGNRIMANSTRFFANSSRPSGMLTAPGRISDEVAGRLKAAWEENFSGPNIGRLAVLGDGLAYAPMTIPAEQAQLIEQLKWTVEDVARCFHVPMWKLGDKEPSRVSVESLNQTYYADCLQAHIEAIEQELTFGLGLPANYKIEFDLSSLMRMDTAARYAALGEAVGGGWMTPNEARLSEDLPPVDGGNVPYLQQQNYGLPALAKRDAQDDPFKNASTTPPALSAPPKTPALPAPAPAKDIEDVEQMLTYISKELVAWT